MASYRNDPFECKSRSDTKCKETGKPIAKGENCVYYPLGRGYFHNESSTAQQFREWNFDQQYLGCNY